MIKSVLVRFGAAIAAGLLMAGGAAAPAAAAGVGNIDGVYTSHAGAPLAEAFVVAWSEDGSYLSGVSTDADGRYTLAGLPEGPVKLSFQTDWLIQWAPRVLTQEEAPVHQVPAGGTLTVDERRLPAGVISGTVTGVDGQPAAWTRVDAHELAKDIHIYADTDDTGRYTASVWAGDHHVGFGPDSARQWAPQAVTEEDADTITVADGATVRVDEQLLPTGTIGGRLTGVDGSPLPGAEVTLYAGDRTVVTYSTDDEGLYSFPVLPGAYVVSFRPDYNAAEQFVPGAVTRAKATVYTVTAGSTVVADDAVLKPSTVSGRLVGADGRGKANHEVLVMSTDDENGYSAVTRSDGRWEVEDVQPADYRVSFTSPSGRTQWAYGSASSNDATVITVDGGESVTVDDTWLTGATLLVKAVDEVSGAAVSDFCVQVASGNGFGEGCARGGTATLTDVSPGPATVDVTPGASGFYLHDEGNPVTLAAGQTATITVPLAKGGKVSFTAADRATGAAVAEACFAVLATGGGGLPDGVGDCTDDSGRLTSATVAPGSYQAFVVAPGDYGHQWVGKKGGTGHQKAAASIVVTADTTTTAPQARLDPAGSITGVLTEAGGGPAVDADVSYTAWGYGPGPAHSVSTDEDGRYTIDKLGPYAWPLSFTASGHPRQWSGNAGNRFLAVRVPVTAGATATYDMTLARGASLAGTVTLPSGAAATGWRLTAVNAVTGDQIGVVDSYDRPAGVYTMPVIGGQKVRIRWERSGDGNVAGSGVHPTAVSVPSTGTKRLNLTIG